jgi:hypothetical protein
LLTPTENMLMHADLALHEYQIFELLFLLNLNYPELVFET